MNNNFYGIERRNEETEFEYCLRVAWRKIRKLILDWADWSEAFRVVTNAHYDTYAQFRRE